MKKKLILLLVLALTLMAFAACGGDVVDNGGDDDGDDAVVGELKLGMAVISGIAKSKDAGDADGVAQGDSTVVAVTVDEDGVITNCIIDHAMTVVKISADGKIVTPLDTVFLGKKELGDDYGMRKASQIGREWDEQANDLAAYIIGKTLAEVKEIAITEDGNAADEDLSSSVTVTITGYIAAIEKAVNNAEFLGASVGDKLGLGLVTTIDKSKDAGDADGLVQIYTHYAAVTFDGDDVITSAVMDASQANINFSAEGKITSDLATVVKTKVELGDDYGMRKASPIGKEWFEQAEAFAEYIVGKTAAEVGGIALTDGGEPSGDDLTSSVTMTISDMMDVVGRAFKAAI